ncbi:phenylalanyl-tRNA synthetase beta subunit [Muriicola jejuensis]|uniref:Phenylalanine--tRNA ligase beta subunit n=1 Tax=Muriicola jejuensis TaxID=504488 RepID=A0A6P0UDH8_9FLAO|nr:phenylalanine--tRNA ligase subunit beta [Muriicola jejuensis]NER11107.1 phenylalanine--tRNA ligase subunit beta [Muriicola jejuensis]SMP23778.1 phenylalanyl-tRNA synthetase beta subunit [Muriicola jejuensis]
MQISYNWLKQFLPIDWEPTRVAELLTDLGLEVEGISPFESVRGGLKGVVVGHVLTCEKHPNADKLKLTTVDVGSKKVVQIVCGAPNVAKGQKVPVATVGTTLFMNNGETLKIKKGKIRGEVSEGMICAEDELGLGEDHAGIMVLENALKPGTPLSELYEIENDQVFEIGLTPNRADAMSHFGVARDLKAGLRQKGIQKELLTPSISNFIVANRSRKIAVSVEDHNLAPRYCGVTISNLIVQPSPNWLKNRLKAIGLKPINNVVDATNYVLHELGQPLHAFDADRIFGKQIIVRTVEGGTPFMTLDGEERILHEDDLMICDGEKPMCIAGVFGGINTGVTENTKAIFLESAFFDPVTIRKTAKRHGLSTDASFRFERGVDINNVEYALQRAALLICELTGGDISSDLVDLYPKKKEDNQVFLTFEKINKLIGQEIPRDVIKSILTSLEIKVKSVTETGLGLTIPFYRIDVTREVDVIEEILRVYGYNNVDFDPKLHASIATTSRFEDHILQNKVGGMLAARGFFEILSNSLTNPEYKKLLAEEKGSEVRVINPLSSELSALRSSMLFSSLEAAAYNINRKRNDLKLFEFGKTYHPSGTGHEEKQRLSLLVTGNRTQESWTLPSRQSDFFYLRAVVEQILTKMGITQYQTRTCGGSVFSEGLTFAKDQHDLVSLGVVSSAIQKRFDIKQELLYADFNWDVLCSLVARNEIIFRSIPKFPSVRRDFALLLDQDVPFNRLEELAYKAENKLLKDLSLFDVYTGDKLPEGKKSYAVSFTLQDESKTLTDKQIDKIMNKIKSAFEKELGAVLR